VFAIPIFARTGPDRWARWFFIANGLITPLFATTYFAPGYSVPILLLGSPWGTTRAEDTEAAIA
jgi:hypothetical protein